MPSCESKEPNEYMGPSSPEPTNAQTTNFFPVEASVRVESARYGDIVQTDYLDSYHNLTFKAVSWMRWVDAHCPHVQASNRRHSSTELRKSLCKSC